VFTSNLNSQTTWLKVKLKPVNFLVTLVASLTEGLSDNLVTLTSIVSFKYRSDEPWPPSFGRWGKVFLATLPVEPVILANVNFFEFCFFYRVLLKSKC